MLTGCGQVEAARIQSFLDAVRVRSRGDDDTATIGLEAAADELGHRVEKERVLFIELGEVPWLVHLVHLGRRRELRRFDAWVFFGTHLRNSLSITLIATPDHRPDLCSGASRRQLESTRAGNMHKA